MGIKKDILERTFEHSSLLKKIVNPVLKVIQFWTKEPYQIISIVKTENGVTAFVEYSLKKVLLFKDKVEYADLLLSGIEKVEEKTEV